MSCYEPILAINLGTKPDGKKEIILQTKRKTETLEQAIERIKKAHGTAVEILKLPCGKCIGCRLSKAATNADQIMLEAKMHPNNCVLHLTYDNEHVPITNVINKQTGEVYKAETLCKKDFQDFLKRLRIHYKRKYGMTNIRTAYCGEYGEKKGRPHGHMILFNFRPIDLKFWEESKSGYLTYVSKEVSKIWGKGIVKINDLSREMAEYIARYITKKWKGEDRHKYEVNKIPEFYNCSNKPGIGYEYYQKNKTIIYQTDEIFIKSLKGTRSKKPPKYFDKLFEREELPTLQEIKERRKERAEERMNTMLQITGWKESEYLQMQKEAREEKVRTLKRKNEQQKITIDCFGRRHYE